MKDGIKEKNEKRSASSMVHVILLLLTVCAPLTAFAVSYPPLYHREVRHDRFVKGDTVYMFHSGTDGVRNTVHVNDTLAVYRVTTTCEVVAIGTVRVVSFVGETYIKGEVLAGELKPDDMAKKGDVSCLIISAGVCDH